MPRTKKIEIIREERKLRRTTFLLTSLVLIVILLFFSSLYSELQIEFMKKVTFFIIIFDIAAMLFSFVTFVIDEIRYKIKLRKLE